MGHFNKDAQGNALLRVNQRGEFIDNKGRFVNEKGYLIDKLGNIIGKNGKHYFEQRELKNGEVPKILPFSKFNLKNV